MATFVHVYTGPDGQSVVEEREFEMQSFVDTEGAHGLSTGMINTPASPSGSTSRAIFWTSTPRRAASTALR